MKPVKIISTMPNLFVKLFCVLCQLQLMIVTSLPSVNVQADKCSAYPKLNALPGKGWCSLRNIEMNPVFSLTYDKCQVFETPDGNYLIPDHISVTPKSKSDIDTTQELILSHQDFTSITASSMSASASGGFGIFSAAASFSSDYQNLKKKQVINKSVTVRNSARYVQHDVRIDEYAVELHPDLKDRLLNAIEAISNGHLAKASLILELAILSYGTHVITNVDLGGVIVKEDYISETYSNQKSEDQHSMIASASIGFGGYLNINAGYSKDDYASEFNEYAKNIKATKIRSYGGELIKSATFNISNWVASLPNYLVRVDGSGVALPFVITSKHFPSANSTILAALTREYVEAIEHFNAVNIRVGCMSQGSPNFDYNANVADKSCDNPPTNFSLGGIFQTCHCDNQNVQCSECDNYVVKNFFTGDTSCPANFTKVYLNGKSFTKSWQRCHTTYYMFYSSTNCETEYLVYEYKAYWCAAGQNIDNNGLMFGGLFTTTSKNPVTNGKNCPPTFYAVTFLQDITVCIGKDYEVGYKYSIPFGGFFSCNQGNPLATVTSTSQNNITLKNTAARPNCGDGFTQHPAGIDNDCLVSYCIKANAFGSEYKEITIVLPPFQNYEEMFAEEAMLNGPVISGSSIAIIVLGSLLVLIISGIACFIGLKKRRPSLKNYAPIIG